MIYGPARQGSTRYSRRMTWWCLGSSEIECRLPIPWERSTTAMTHGPWITKAGGEPKMAKSVSHSQSSMDTPDMCLVAPIQRGNHANMCGRCLRWPSGNMGCPSVYGQITEHHLGPLERGDYPCCPY